MSIFLSDEETVEIIDSEKYDMIVYLTTNLITGKKYIGQSIYNYPSYLGSGPYFSNSLNKHGKENFTKEILKHCKSIDILNYWEMFYIIEYNTVKPFGYNLDWGGRGKGRFSKETIKKISGENHHNYGKHRSDETKKKQSEKMKGRHHSDASKLKMSGENNPMYGKKGKDNHLYGKHPSKATREKMSIRMSGENHPQYGKCGKDTPNYGKKRSDATKKKMRDKRKEYWRKRKEWEQTQIKNIQVCQFNLKCFI